MSALLHRQLEWLRSSHGTAGDRGAMVRPAVTHAAPLPQDASDRRLAIAGGPIELSRAQRELHALIVAHPAASIAYREHVAFEMQGPLDLAALQQSWRLVVGRHEATRLRVHADGTGALATELPTLVVSEPAQVPVDVATLIESVVNEPFRPFGEPLIGARILYVGPQRHLLVVSAHHLAADGWSIGLLLSELAQVYTAAVQGRAASLGAVQQFSEFVGWAARLSPAEPPRTFPGDDMSPLVLPGAGLSSGFEGFRLHLQDPQVAMGEGSRLGLLRAARACARTLGVAPVVVVLSSFAVFLARLAGQRRIRIGLPVAGHAMATMPAMVGMASAVQPVDIRLDEVETFEHAVQQVDVALQQARAGAQQLFAGDWVGPPVSVLFNIDPGVTLDFEGLSINPVPLALRYTKADLFLNLLELNGRLLVDFDCNGSLVTRERAALWLDGFIHLVGHACRHPDTPIRDLGLGPLVAVPRDPDVRLLDAWGGSPAVDQPARMYTRGLSAEFDDSGAMASVDVHGVHRVLGDARRYVRLRGGWVDLDQVQQALADRSEIADAAVLVEAEQITAFVRMPPGVPMNASVIDRALDGLVPANARPTRYVEVDALIRDERGEVDEAALRRCDGPRVPPRQRVAPRSESELLVARTWAQVLGVDADTLGVTDDFFALGGHSLKAVSLVQRVADVTGKAIQLVDFFRQPTIAGMAQLLQASVAVQPIPTRARAELDVASHAQQRMWVLEQLDGGQGAYNMGFAVRRRAAMRSSDVEAALGDLAMRHESLRMAIVESGGEVRARVESTLQPQLAVHDLRFGPPAAESGVEALASEWVRRPFELGQAPLWRAALVHLEQGDVLLVAMHHAIGDNWTASIWIRDFLRLLAVHEAGADAASAELPELPIQYGDYAAWHNRLVDRSDASMAYWRQTLADPPERLLLPASGARVRTDSAGGVCRRRLSPRAHASFSALCRDQGTSGFVTLLALWRLWLWAQTGARDAVVGTVHAGRDHPALADQVGLFVNTLPLRLPLAPEGTFLDLLRTARVAVAQAFEHAHVPLNRILEVLGAERESYGHPLFETLVTHDDFRDMDAELWRQGWSAQEIDLPVSQFELCFAGHEDAIGMELRLRYRSSLWSDTEAQGILAELEELLDRVCRDPSRTVADLSLPADVCVPAAELGVVGNFERWRQQQPMAVAVLGAVARTYDDVGIAADALAVRLSMQGLGEGSVVAILVGRDWELPVAALGVLKARAGFVFLDAAQPPERLAFILRDAACRVIVHDEQCARLAAVLGTGGADAPRTLPVIADPCASSADDQAAHPALAATRLPPPAPDDLAYVIYTSGSTGQPKGVLIEHEALMHHLAAMTPLTRWSRADRSLLFATVAVDAVIEQLFLPLVNGASLFILDQERYCARAYIDAWRRWDATILDVPPLFWGELIAQCEREPDLVRGRVIKTLMSGGEEMTRQRVSAWWNLPVLCHRLLNLFGPTETTCSPMVALVPPYMATRPRIPIGRPVGRRLARVVDADGLPIPPGLEGELMLGGASVARGYLNREDLTAARFSVDEHGQRWYRTGDRVVLRPDGDFEYLGRMDRQFKLRGFRIEPGEIEDALRRHAGIRDAVVTVEPGEDGGHLQAWLVALPDAVPSRAKLMKALAAELPAHMVPGRYRCVTHLPLSASEKLDQRALRQMPGQDLWDDQTSAAPTAQDDPIQRLCGLVAAVVGVPAVAPGDNFFAVGGHSLTAVQVVARVRGEFGVEIRLRDVFAAPDVTALWHTIAASAVSSRPRITPVPRDHALPASPGQQRLWLLQSRQPDSVAYNMTAAFRLSGALQLQALRAALRGVVARHEVLRTRLRMKGGVLVQDVVPAKALVLPDVESDNRPEALESVRMQELQRPFRLEAELPIRFRLVQSGSFTGLVINVHHAAFDGWSTTVLLRDLAALYRSACSGPEGLDAAMRGDVLDGSLPALEIQYGDFAQWQRHVVAGAHRDYWLGEFAGVVPPMLDLPVDRPRPASPSGRGGMVVRSLGVEASRGLRDLAVREGVTLFGVLVALVAAHLRAVTGNTDMVLGAAVAGRDSDQVVDQVGFYVNMLPLRCRVDSTQSFGQLARATGERATRALLHQDYPFDELVYEAAVPRLPGHHPIFDVIVNLQNFEPVRLDLPGVSSELLEDRSVSAKLDLQYMFDDLESIDLYLEYARDVYDESTAARLADDLTSLVAVVLAQPEATLDAVLTPRAWRSGTEAAAASPAALENDEW